MTNSPLLGFFPQIPFQFVVYLLGRKVNKKLDAPLPYSPVVPGLSIYPRETGTFCTSIHASVQNSISSPKTNNSPNAHLQIKSGQAVASSPAMWMCLQALSFVKEARRTQELMAHSWTGILERTSMAIWDVGFKRHRGLWGWWVHLWACGVLSQGTCGSELTADTLHRCSLC